MRQTFVTLLMMCSLIVPTWSAVGQEITIEVNPDDSVHVTQGFELEEVLGNDDATDPVDVSRMTVLFPEQKPAVYELDSEEDYVLIVDGWLPEGADILVEATDTNTGEEVEAFEHVIRGGDWLIDAKYMNELPRGEVTLTATLRTPGRSDASASHPFYILEPGEIGNENNTEWFEWEVGENNGRPFVPGEGFMTFDPPSDARVYYVSASGSDSNNGLSEARPLRTCRAAYEKVRDDSGDWVLLKAGETFDGGFGVWAKSGQSAERPLHIGVYGDGDRPIVHSNGSNFWRGYGEVSNIRIDGIHAFANKRLGVPREDLIFRESGFAHFGKGQNFFFHDVKIEGFKFNLVLQGYSEGSIRNVMFYRCIVNSAFGHWDSSIGGHSSGIYAHSVTNMEFIECTFDRNGWHPNVRGAIRTKFNHNMYIQYNCSNVNVKRSIITRGSSHGLQLRCGGDVVDNLFVRNALGFFVQLEPSQAVDNVVIECDDIDDREIRGQGITINPTTEALVANNIITRKVGRAGWMSALQTSWTKDAKKLPSYRVQMHDNIVWDWWMDKHHDPIKASNGNVTRYNNAVDGVVTETGRRVLYRNPRVGMDDYAADGFSEFLQNAVQRRRGEWIDEYSAPAFNAYMREGFSPRGSGSDL